MGINLTKMTTNVNNIQALSDLPNQTDGLTAQGLKERYDKAGSDIKTFLNTSLIPEIEELMNLIYPIGRGFIDFTNTDYSNYLGFTWERELLGVTPVGVNPSDTDFNEVGKTGGEKTHKLIEDELPKISGQMSWHGQEHGTHVYQLSGHYYGTKMNNMYQTTGKTSGAFSYSNTGFKFGNDGAHNNLQPYQVVSYWKRVS